MTIRPDLLVPLIIGLLASLYPVPWHLKTRNVATLSMVGWLSVLQIVGIINIIAWRNDDDIRAIWWCDITVAIHVAKFYGLPLAHLLLAKQLEQLTSLRRDSVLYDGEAMKRSRRIDLAIVIVVPALAAVAHVAMMAKRFYLIEGVGPVPATYWDGWAICFLCIIPALIAVACGVYTFMALSNVRRRRGDLMAMLVVNNSVDDNNYIRLLLLALAELLACTLKAAWGILLFTGGAQPIIRLQDGPARDYSTIEQISYADLTPSLLLSMQMQFWSAFICSVIFFMCFAASTETKRFYMNVLRRLIPCIPWREDGECRKDVSKATDSDAEHGLNSRKSSVQGDLSFEEMLGASPRTTTWEKESPWLSKEMYPSFAEADVGLYLQPLDEIKAEQGVDSR